MHLFPFEVDAFHFGVQDVEAPALLKGTDGDDDVVRVGASIGHGPQQRGEQQVVVAIHDQDAGIGGGPELSIELQCGSQPAESGPQDEYTGVCAAIGGLGLTDMFCAALVSVEFSYLSADKTGSYCQCGAQGQVCSHRIFLSLCRSSAVSIG